MKGKPFADTLETRAELLRYETRLAAPHLVLCTCLYRIPLESRAACGLAVLSLDLTDGASECASAPDVAVSEKEAETLYSLVTEGLVTPCALGGVIEDWLGTR